MYSMSPSTSTPRALGNICPPACQAKEYEENCLNKKSKSAAFWYWFSKFIELMLPWNIEPFEAMVPRSSMNKHKPAQAKCWLNKIIQQLDKCFKSLKTYTNSMNLGESKKSSTLRSLRLNPAMLWLSTDSTGLLATQSVQRCRDYLHHAHHHQNSTRTKLINVLTSLTSPAILPKVWISSSVLIGSTLWKSHAAPRSLTHIIQSCRPPAIQAAVQDSTSTRLPTRLLASSSYVVLFPLISLVGPMACMSHSPPGLGVLKMLIFSIRAGRRPPAPRLWQKLINRPPRSKCKAPI
jgi:hypothetical protein